MIRDTEIVLGIESAVGGGSISLLRDGFEVASWIGSSNVSKAQDLLANIDTLLSDNQISRKQINLIAVSAGPGSFTGIRIGLATALGLKAGLGIEMASETALKSMVDSHDTDGIIIASLPVGRNAVCMQTFQIFDRKAAALDDPRTITETEFTTLVGSNISKTFLLHSILYESIEEKPNTRNFGASVASAIAHTCRANPSTMVKPLFIRKAF